MRVQQIGLDRGSRRLTRWTSSGEVGPEQPAAGLGAIARPEQPRLAATVPTLGSSGPDEPALQVRAL